MVALAWPPGRFPVAVAWPTGRFPVAVAWPPGRFPVAVAWPPTLANLALARSLSKPHPAALFPARDVATASTPEAPCFNESGSGPLDSPGWGRSQVPLVTFPEGSSLSRFWVVTSLELSPEGSTESLLTPTSVTVYIGSATADETVISEAVTAESPHRVNPESRMLIVGPSMQSRIRSSSWHADGPLGSLSRDIKYQSPPFVKVDRHNWNI